MAYYSYKQVRDLLPKHIIDQQGPGYEGDPGYDGDQWTAAADYINELKASLTACRPYIRASMTQAQQRLKMIHNADGPAPAHLNPKHYLAALEAEEKRLQELIDGIDRICGS